MNPELDRIVKYLRYYYKYFLMNEKWLPLYKEMINDRRFYIDKAWETIKFFTTIYTAILSITILLAINLPEKNSTINVAVLIIFLPLSAMLISIIGWLNFRRQIARTYETVATLIKAEKLLGFHDMINEENRVFKKDKYALPNYFVEINENIKLEDTNCFIGWMFKRKAKTEYRKFYSTFTWLFRIYFFIALIFTILLAVIIKLIG